MPLLQSKNLAMDVHNVIIIGSGPAGYSAAVYAARANLNPVIISGVEEGGQLMTTTDVDNWPGEADGILGPTLMEQMKKHALRFDTTILNERIKEVDFSKRPFTLVGDNGTYKAKSVIIATGSSAKYLGLESETKFRGKGVSACATCDGFFFKNRNIAVIGGGNTAVEEALFLSNIAKQVTIIHRRDKFSSEKILADRVMAKVKNGNIDIKWNTTLTEVIGDDLGVTGLTLQNTTNNSTQHLDVFGVFIAIGHTPNTDIFKNKLDMNHGYITVQGGLEGNVTATNVKGVYAAGDCADYIYRQAITSAGSGCQAALDVEKFLDEEQI